MRVWADSLEVDWSRVAPDGLYTVCIFSSGRPKKKIFFEKKKVKKQQLIYSRDPILLILILLPGFA